MSVISLSNNNNRHSSSSTFIAHLLVQEYPPKVQPRSSSERDNALYGDLDKVDCEASCILIALANHDKRKDMNDLIPYSIRVIDYNQPTTDTMDSALENSSTTSSSSNSSSNSNSNSNSSNSSTTSSDHDKLTEGTMSIKNLLGMNEQNTTTSDTTLSGNTDQVLTNSTTSSTLSSPKTQQDPLKKSSSWKRKPRSDPILLLAAAAKAIDQDEQLQQRANQKRKYSEDDSSLDSRSIRPRHSMESTSALHRHHHHQSEQSKFSYQYLSMKQNPKIKRNAMHAYITYMIYTDLASSSSSDKMYHEKHHHQPSINVGQHETTTSSSYGPLPIGPPHSKTVDHQNYSATSKSDHWPYRTSSPSLPPFNTSSSSSSSSSIMARPLTAFLRDDMYT
ncbi:uncharacterized protein BX664DRAFT_359861 [Halteromyces radiatus]|uniref:uncharacterized protein n=1 Tax=Halteromyces radiatus TaxID=101107 RepID=UPI0022208171|nr:uncharacterized protein BX664DRAFT_359861 [Halteromyces radiatus]KAI8086321.1 hypothetical protein BX664DRAFT_359861 [Halteromyces radiatus]